MMTNSEPHSPLKEKTRADFGGASDPNAELHDESAEEFEQKFGDDPARALEEERMEEEDNRRRQREERDRGNLNETFRKEADGKDSAGFDKAGRMEINENGMRYEGSVVKDYILYGMRGSLDGSHYRFNENKQMTDKQLRRMILRAHLEHKDWKTLYFYGKDGKIDQQLTMRANDIIGSFGRSKSPKLQAIAETGLRASPVSMSGLEPWRHGPLAHLSKAIEKNWSETRAESKTQRSNTGRLGIGGADKLVS